MMRIWFAPNEIRWHFAGDPGVGRGLMGAAEPAQGLEGGHRREAAVVPEDVLVEVDLKVLVADSAVGSVYPGLEVGDRAVRARGSSCSPGLAVSWGRRRWS
jgi:hypothetical protein